MSKRRRTDDLPAMPAPHLVGLRSIGGPGRPRQLFLEKAAGIGRRIQEQHAGGFGAGVFPRMRYAARQEGTGAGPADRELVADLEAAVTGALAIWVSPAVMSFGARGARLQPARHAGPPGFQRGHLPHLDRGRQRGDGARRGEGHRGADPQALRGLPAARRADHHFVNKLDREGRDPFDLLNEIEQSLALDVTPASWPIGRARFSRHL